MLTAEEVASELTTRASYYGGTLGDILAKTPVCLWDSPSELMEFWDQKDLSHIYPRSTFPEMSDDWTNIIPEDAAINRARGAAVMSDLEVQTAMLDNQRDAEMIDVLFGDDDPEFAAELVELIV